MAQSGTTRLLPARLRLSTALQQAQTRPFQRETANGDGDDDTSRRKRKRRHSDSTASPARNLSATLQQLTGAF